MAIVLKFDWDRSKMEHIAMHSVVSGEVEQAFSNGEMRLDYSVVFGEDRWRRERWPILRRLGH